MDLTKISKFISLVLRHKPEEAHITLDKHGWADAQLLVEGVAAKYPGFTFADLEEIVRTDEKGRYSFSEDRTEIRANQGHSIPVDLGLEPMEPPKRLYHGSGMKYKDGIMKDGILPKSRQYVHLSGDIPTAIAVGERHGEAVVFEINADEMYEDGYEFRRSLNGVWLVNWVPREYIRGFWYKSDEEAREATDA